MRSVWRSQNVCFPLPGNNVLSEIFSLFSFVLWWLCLANVFVRQLASIVATSYCRGRPRLVQEIIGDRLLCEDVSAQTRRRVLKSGVLFPGGNVLRLTDLMAGLLTAYCSLLRPMVTFLLFKFWQSPWTHVNSCIAPVCASSFSSSQIEISFSSTTNQELREQPFTGNISLKIFLSRRISLTTFK